MADQVQEEAVVAESRSAQTNHSSWMLLWLSHQVQEVSVERLVVMDSRVKTQHSGKYFELGVVEGAQVRVSLLRTPRSLVEEAEEETQTQRLLVQNLVLVLRPSVERNLVVLDMASIRQEPRLRMEEGEVERVVEVRRVRLRR